MRLHFLGALAVAAVLGTGAAHAERLTDQPLVDTQWLTEHLGNPSLVVIDIRDAGQAGDPYAAGHVPGAIPARYSEYGWRTTVDSIPGMLPPEAEIEAKIAALGISNDTHVVIVPAGTNASEFGGATRVYWTFKVLGHDAVSILDGGFSAWTKANGAVSTEAAAPAAPGTFDGTFRPEILAEVAEVTAAIESDSNLLDARSVAQFIGQEKTNTVQSLGHIPSAVNITFDNFYDAENSRFATPEKVAELAQAAGIGADKEVITFCNTGHLASIAWFGLSEVGKYSHVRLYDGSMSQWTADANRPVTVN